MEKREQEKWLTELTSLVTKKGLTWESMIGNFAMFFLQHDRQDIAVSLFEFICKHGDFTLMASFNLSSHYLRLAKYFTMCGTMASSPPISDMSKWSKESVHPDALVNILLKRKDGLDSIQ